MTRIKICGLTRLEDVELALSLGVEALGFNFVPGTPRALDAERARPLCEHARGRALRVGVFRDQACDAVRALARELELDAIQLHGDESPTYAAALDLPVLKALRAEPDVGTRAEAYPEAELLLDHPSGGGGTGRVWDFDRARALVRSGRRVWIAGGLRPENVAAAVAAAGPYGVDACSGIEAAPGQKSAAALRAFVEAARGAVPPGAGE